MSNKLTKELEIVGVKIQDKGNYECFVKDGWSYSATVCAELSELTCIYY